MKTQIHSNFSMFYGKNRMLLIFTLIFCLLCFSTELAFGQKNNKEKKVPQEQQDKKKIEPKKKQSDGKKYIICHTPPRNSGKSVTIEVSEKALKAHMEHGDAMGPCVSCDNCTGTVTTKYPSTGKSESVLSSNLESLVQFFEDNGSAASDEIFIISNGSEVMIEIIAVDDPEPTIPLIPLPKDQIVALLLNVYGITEYFTEEINSLIITVLFPIDKLAELKGHESIIRQVREVNPPVSNSGFVTSLGDIAQQSMNARNAFGVTGFGFKVCVISDSYDTQGQAQYDVLNGDLPGTGNPENHTEPVQVLNEISTGLSTYYTLSDEGRAIMQIVHDVAPGAVTAFHTGYLSSEYMAIAINALADDDVGCDVIVDDLTHTTEPFFIDGMIARAVEDLPPEVFYVTSAGNFGENSHTGTFNPANSDAIYHDFNETDQEDMMQSVKFEKGYYKIVLQWKDDHYSLRDILGDNNEGAQNDLDLFLVDDDGNILAAAEDDNSGNDPVEIMNFSVEGGDLQANFMIKGATGTENVDFKYIVFRGNGFDQLEYGVGTSTIMGHANSERAITVGAMHYDFAPAFQNLLNVASFSSRGGTPIKGESVLREKPDIIAPNGVSTSVELGGIDYDEDGFSDFFGTSAAAPHVAGAIALLMEFKEKFNLPDLNIEDELKSNAIDMYSKGFDFLSGAGFIQVDAAMIAFAAPAPEISSISAPEKITPGNIGKKGFNFKLTIEGKNFTKNTNVTFNNGLISSTFVNSTQITANIKSPFDYEPPENDPLLEVINDPFQELGGGSDDIHISSLFKSHVTIEAVDMSKKYGESLPEPTASIFVDGIPLDQTSPLLSLEDLGLEYSSDDVIVSLIDFETSSTSTTDIPFKYFIRPVLRPQPDPEYLLKYNYELIDGSLTVEKMPLTIQPNELTITYGDRIFVDLDEEDEEDEEDENNGITFQYSFDETNIENAEAFRAMIRESHLSTFNGENYIAIINDESDILGDRGHSLVNLTAWSATNLSLSNRGHSLVNGNIAVDIEATMLEDYDADPIGVLSNRGMSLVNAESLINDEAVITIADRGMSLVNNDGGLVTSNDETDGFSDVVIIVDEEDYSISTLYSINLITGLDATWPDDDPQYIVPGAMISLEANYFDITYELGNLWIDPAELNVTNKWIINDDPVPDFTSTIIGFAYEETAETVFSSISYEPTEYSGKGAYPIVPTFQFYEPINYLDPEPGILTVVDENDLRYLVSTNDGLKLIDAVGNTITLINSNSTGVEVYGDYIYVLDVIDNEWTIEEYNLQGEFSRSFTMPEQVVLELNQFVGFVILPNLDFALLDNRDDKIYFIDSQGDYLATVDMLNPATGILQNLDGIVVDNNLIMSDNGKNQLIKVDLQSFEVSIFRDLSHLTGWLGAIDYYNGTYYICQAMDIWSFSENSENEALVATIPENNITGIVVAGKYAYVTVNHYNKVYKVDILSGKSEVFAEELLYAQDIEVFLPVYSPSPVNGRIAVAAWNNNGDTDLIVVNSDGSNPITLVDKVTVDIDGTDTELKFVRYPDFSPDGTQIAFTMTDNSVTSGIWIINTDGSGLRKLTDVAEYNRAEFSPDGSKIVFDDSQEVLEIYVDGTGLRTLTSTTENVLWSTYSSDGQEIYFTMYKESGGGYNDIHKVNIDNLFVEEPVSDQSTSIFYKSPEISPDGMKIIHAKAIRDGVTGDAIMSLNLDGTNPQTIYPGSVRETSVSPDNKKIAFTGGGKLHVMNYDGSDFQEIYNGGNNGILEVSWGTYPDEPEMFMAQSSISSKTQGDFTIYPNPVVNVLTIIHEDETVLIGDIGVFVYDGYNGSDPSDLTPTLLETEVGFEVDLSGLASGNYILHISDGNTIEEFHIQKE